MSVQGAGMKIRQAVTSWPRLSAHPHRFGGTEFRIGRREIGHVHADALVDIPFPRRVRNQVIAAGAAEPHHVLPDSGWVSLFLRSPEDVAAAIALLRLSYDLALQQRSSPEHSLPSPQLDTPSAED